MEFFIQKYRQRTWLPVLLLSIIMLAACQPIVDDRSPVEKAFDVGSLMAINGTELFVKVMGEGEPIIMLHGGPAPNTSFLRNTLKRWQPIIN